MTKIYALLPKRPDITAEQFHRHWSTVHRELVVRVKDLRGYVQAHRVDADIPGIVTAPFEGIPEVWADDLAAAVAMGESPEFTEHAQKDEPNFIDVSGIRRLMTHHRVLDAAVPLAMDTPAMKAMLLVRRPDGIRVEEFQADWWPMADALAGKCDGLIRTAASTTLPETYGADEPPYDAVAELWWPDRATYEAAWRTGGPDVLSAVGDVADLKRSQGFLCEELRVVWVDDAVASGRAGISVHNVQN
jgi:uncharacterized protein (TIGR02118 family)